MNDAPVAANDNSGVSPYETAATRLEATFSPKLFPNLVRIGREMIRHARAGSVYIRPKPVDSATLDSIQNILEKEGIHLQTR